MKSFPYSFAAFLVFTSLALCEGGEPIYKMSRQDEDWSSLRDPAMRTHFFDDWKFIPLNQDASAWLSLGGELRERYEYFDHANWGAGPQDDNGYLLQRYMLHGDVHAGEHFRLFTEFQAGLEEGRNGGPRPTDRNEFDIHQLFADIGEPFGDKQSLTLRLGRQELGFGSQRLVSLRDAPNVRRAFDGLRATLSWGDWQFDAFVTRPVRIKPGVLDDDTDPTAKFWGFYGVAPFPLLQGGRADLYYFGLDRDSATFAQGTAHERRHSLGTRLWGKHSGWDWNYEFVYQFGDFGNGHISAWTVATDTGYTFAHTKWTPRIGFKADVTSGDRDPNDPDLQTFNPLFPRGGYFAETGLIGPQNHIDLHPSLELHPTSKVTFTTDLDFFWRESSHDGVYGIGQNVARSGVKGGSSYVGSQATAQVEWRINRHLTWTVNYAHFFAAAFLNENPPARDVNFVATWLTCKF